MMVKYKRGGKIWRRYVWLPHWYGQPTPWPPIPRRPHRGLALIACVAAMGGTRR